MFRFLAANTTRRVFHNITRLEIENPEDVKLFKSRTVAPLPSKDRLTGDSYIVCYRSEQLQASVCNRKASSAASQIQNLLLHCLPARGFSSMCDKSKIYCFNKDYSLVFLWGMGCLGIFLLTI